MAVWADLPIEICCFIFKALTRDLVQWRSDTRNRMAQQEPLEERYTLTRYSCVCKAWQPFFEKLIYRQLIIDQKAISWFARMDRRHRGHVEHIWLKIYLHRYDCSACMWPEPSFQDFNSRIVGRHVRQVFIILHRWGLGQGSVQRQPSLEISAHSMSDMEHVFMYTTFFETNINATGNLKLLDPSVTARNLVGVVPRAFEPTIESLDRIFGYLQPSPVGLPRVENSKSVTIRRQTRQRLSPYYLMAVFDNLPHLERLHYETWREFLPDFSGRYVFDPIHARMISILPGALRELTIFEDFNEDYNEVYSHAYGGDYSDYLVRMPDVSVAIALASRSRRLTNMSVSYMVDARHFFHACRGFEEWTRLQTLDLTSPVMTTAARSYDVDALLVNAACVALRMPLLRRMTLWNGRRENACSFSYEVTQNETSIRVRGTWDWKVQRGVLDPWKHLAWVNTRNMLTLYEYPKIDPDLIKSHAVAIRVLELPRSIVHPVSLKQIERETELYEYENPILER